VCSSDLTIAPWAWGSLKTNIGVDNYTNSNLILRHPESTYGYSNGGILDINTDLTRNISAQTLLNLNSRQIWQGLSISGVVGNAVSDYKSNTDAQQGLGFLDPNFVSVNNTNSRTARTTISQRRLVSVFGSATVDYNKYLYVTVTGRNDWTSTIPEERNSFFYPSVNTSFIFSDAFPAVGQYMTGKLRAGYAQVGKDARPYAYKPALEYKLTSYGGYGYSFWGPNLALKQAQHIHGSLVALDPAGREEYDRNLARLADDLQELDRTLRTILQPLAGQTIYVFHPAYGYFCRAYNLKQKAINVLGKETGARHLARLIEEAKRDGVRVIFVQPQFSEKTAETIARSIGGSVVPLDNLSRDYLANMKAMALQIAAAQTARQQEGQ